ncbi:MAG: hypothetical protein FWG89_08165 [Treponema sp.]|nr:hypothetical protein [Treponema sp.]
MKNSMYLKILSILVLAVIMAVGCDMSPLEVATSVDAAPPFIYVQPQNVSMLVNNSALLEVEAHSADGGELSYQWYRYISPAEYELHLGTPIPDATSSVYETGIIFVERSYNFYVVVTNTNNNATSRRTATAQSRSVMVNVNDPSNALLPSIITHPQNVPSIVFSRDMNLPELFVEAEVEEGELSYQWFVASELTNTHGEEIPFATATVFRPVPTAPGEYYYFVRVTNFDFSKMGNRESFVLSNPARVSVIPNPDAVVPVINSQPRGAIYFNGDTIRPITVDAVAEDGGELSYQWQVRTSASGATPEVFEDVTTGTGATTAAFTPALSLTAAGTTRYRVIITNFAEHAQVEQYASITSNAADIVVATATTDNGYNVNLTLSIANLTAMPANTDAGRSSSNKNQFVRGFGSMDTAWANFPNLTQTDIENMLNPDILGYNVQRIMILPHNEDPVQMLTDFTATAAGLNYFHLVRRVNYYGGYVLASPWTPPAVWKTNNSTIGTNASLREQFYPNYANYLRVYGQAMANNGAPVYTISIQNEPNHNAAYDGCNWTGDMMRNFFQRVGYFTRAGRSGSDPASAVTWPSNIPGYGGGRELPYVITMSGSSANNPNIHSSAMNNAAAKANIGIIARHPYGSRNVNLAGQLGNASPNVTYSADPREIWQTEFNLNTVSNYNLDSSWSNIWPFLNSIDIHIRNNHENAYIWWAGKRFYSLIGDGEYGTANGQILPRGWAMSHYAKFAKETYHVNITASGTLFTGDTGTATAAVNFQGTDSGNLNPKNYQNIGSGTGTNHGGSAGASSRAVKATAFVRLRDRDYGTGRPMPDPFYVNLTAWNGNVNDIEYISFIIFAPTDVSTSVSGTGSNGFRPGNIKLVLPSGFRISGAEAMRSRQGPGERNVITEWETPQINAARDAAYINLLRNQIISVRLYNE